MVPIEALAAEFGMAESYPEGRCGLRSGGAAWEREYQGLIEEMRRHRPGRRGRRFRKTW